MTHFCFYAGGGGWFGEQVQLSVLKEEKRNLLRRVEELSKKNSKEEKNKEIKEVKEVKEVKKVMELGTREREREREEGREGLDEKVMETQKRYRSQSFSEERNSWREPRRNSEYRNGYGWWYGAVNSTPTTRDAGTMCAVMTRDVGVSHQQVFLPFHNFR